MNKQEIENTIDGLRRIEICLIDATVDGDHIRPYIQTAIKCIEQQLTNGWIPVTDGDYIVTIKGGEVIECQSLKI